MSWSIKAFWDIKDLAVRDVDITDSLCIWIFAKDTNYQGISGVESLLPLFQIIDELDSLSFNCNFIG